MEHVNSAGNIKKNLGFRIIEWIEYALLFIAGVSLVLMLAAVFYGILARAIFGSGVLWTNDFASYLMVYVVFMSAPWVLKEKGHVTIDLLVARFGDKAYKASIIFISIISIIACLLYFMFSFKITYGYFLNGTVMLENVPWPKFLLYLPITVGSLFLIVRFGLMSLEVMSKK